MGTAAEQRAFSAGTYRSGVSIMPEPKLGDEQAEGTAEQAGEQLKVLGRDAAERASQALGQAQDMAVQQYGELERAIRRNPTQAVLIAGGIGFVVGLFVRR
jgi:ElaB/YqjD/DUF883 family membrane-anchored ribosome-binding protein